MNAARISPTDRLTATVRRFLAWWGAELRGLVPPGAYGRTGRRLYLDPAEGGLEATLADRRGRTRPLGRVTRTQAPERLEELARRSREGGVSVVLRLPARDVLWRRLRFPKATAVYLGQVVPLELERIVPFDPSDALYDFRVAPAGPREVEVTLALAHRDRVDPHRALAEQWGMAPTAIEVAEPDSQETLDLLRRTRPSERLSLPLRLAALVPVATLLALLAFAHLELAERRDGLERLAARVAGLRGEVAAVAELRQRLEDRRALALAVRAQEERLPRTAILEELARVLPDSAWLVQLRLEEQELRVAGYAANASSLIAALEQSRLFEQVRFAAPILAAEGGRQRFEIAMTVPSGGRP